MVPSPRKIGPEGIEKTSSGQIVCTTCLAAAQRQGAVEQLVRQPLLGDDERLGPRQVGDVAPDPATARTARQAADALHRGVISISSTLDEITGNAEVDELASDDPGTGDRDAEDRDVDDRGSDDDLGPATDEAGVVPVRRELP